MRALLVLLLTLLLLIACDQEPAPESGAVLPSATSASTPTPPPATATDLPAPVPTTAATTGATSTATIAATQAPPASATLLPTATATSQPRFGQTDDGAFFQGAPDAPVTIVDYSDFLWPNCRAYVLGTEPDLVANFVDSNQARIVFWPVINHGQPSVNATLAAHCVGVQDPARFWSMHERLFQDQNALWRADLAYFVDAATAVGADGEIFTACYGSQDALDTILALDELRRQRGIFGQPYFHINGELFAGAPPYETFAEVISRAQPWSAPFHEKL